MTNNSNTPLIVVVCLIVVALFGFLWYRSGDRTPMEAEVSIVNTSTQVVEGNVVQEQGEPTFAWVYSVVEERDMPRSTLSLTAHYTDGTMQTKEIDTIDGVCNDFPTPDSDVYGKSTMIMCYYAGFGHYYKVIEKEGDYIVMRKEFEEGSPEYNPPEQPFKEVVQF